MFWKQKEENINVDVYWVLEYRTQYTSTFMFSSFCFQNILKIQNPVYMYIYVFFLLFPEHSILGSVFSECSENRRKKT
jgi:hypothetical protein